MKENRTAILPALAGSYIFMEQTAPHDHREHGKNNPTLMAVLSYLGILIIIPFLMARDDSFVKFHIRQAAVLVIIELGVWALGLVSLGLWPVVQIVNLGTLILAIIGVVNVLNHKEAELPLVGSFAKHINI